MVADPVDLAAFEFYKDALLAEYHARNLRWQAAQAGGFGAAVLAVLALAGGQISQRAALLIVAASAAVVVLATVVLARLDRGFVRDGKQLLGRLERLKERR